MGSRRHPKREGGRTPGSPRARLALAAALSHVSPPRVKPFRTRPALMRPPWGGNRLAALGKGEGMIGETWEVWRENRLVADDARRLADVLDFPVLVKLLDTSGVLSVQVHPDDALAVAEGALHGKAEGWVVLHAEPGAQIACGLRRELSREELRERALSGEIEADLAWFEPRAGDVFHVPPGTIHAIGAGILLYEVQQTIDLTYRLYDWGRPRELHLDRAILAADLTPRDPRVAPRAISVSVERLLDTPNFILERASLPTEISGHSAVTLVEGSAEIAGESLSPGETLMLPAGDWVASGEGVVLIARPGHLRNGAESK